MQPRAWFFDGVEALGPVDASRLYAWLIIPRFFVLALLKNYRHICSTEAFLFKLIRADVRSHLLS